MKLRIFIILLYTLIILSACNSSYGKNVSFNYNAKNVSNYFSALISFDDFDYIKSQEFFKKIKDSQKYETRYSSKHLQSLITLEKYIEAENYSKNLANKKQDNFESNLILGLKELKQNDSKKAQIYFDKLKPNKENPLIFDVLKFTLDYWSKIDENNFFNKKNIPERYKSFEKIQSVFSNCFFDTSNTERLFIELLDSKQNYSRYNFFFANYLLSKNKKEEAEKVLEKSSKEYPKNLLINQYNLSLINKERNLNNFNCKKKNHVVAEIFYVIASALSSQGQYEISNFYINLSKYLNPNFLSFNSLLAENFFNLKKFEKSKLIYKKLYRLGTVYQWHSDRQIAIILTLQKKEEEALNLLTSKYEKLKPNIYQTFDYANFLRDRKQFKESVKLYTQILNKINKNNPIYFKVLDRRGVAYERLNEFELSEKDLLKSLDIEPEQPYVMNYLAYSWVENSKNFERALEILKKANELREDDGYITDSLGWTYYKLKNFSEAKKYLMKAIMLMPSDPIVNDHFADCLWKNNQKIQARYYWNYVLKLEDTEEDLKKIIKEKLIFGLENT